MARELTQKQLEEMVDGKKPIASAQFFEKAALDVVASKAANKRIYVTTVYVMKSQPGVKDGVSYKATQADIDDYPIEYEHFLNNRQGSQKTIPVQAIPNLQLEHMQELMDIGLHTVQQVAFATGLPDHLVYAQQPARQLQSVIEEYKDGPEQEVEQSSQAQEGAEVPPQDRRQHDNGIGRRELPPSGGSGDEQAPRLVVAGGREHRGDQRELPETQSIQEESVQEEGHEEVDALDQLEAMIDRRVEEAIRKFAQKRADAARVENETAPVRDTIEDDWKVDLSWRD